MLGHVLRGTAAEQRAYVRVARPDGEYVSEVRCGPAGTFYIPVMPGEWKVICFAPGLTTLEQPVDVVRGDQLDIEFWVGAGD